MTITLETERGLVSLWIYQFGNTLKLFYPLKVELSEQLIMDTLKVTKAKPVKNAWRGTRLWASFYSERLKEGGRVWIENSNYHPSSFAVKRIGIDGKLYSVLCGVHNTNTIWTLEYNEFSKESPDAPNCNKQNIIVYQERFFELLIKIAKKIGRIEAISIDFENEKTEYNPLSLEKKNFKVTYYEYKDEEYCYAENEDYNLKVNLKYNTYNSSWNTVLRYTIKEPKELTTGSLIKLVNSLSKL